MTFRIQVKESAAQDMDVAARWYEERAEGMGWHFLGMVDQAVQSIGANPFQWPAWPPSPAYRRCVMERFPFVIYFQVREADVVIQAVAHARRKPGYWMPDH